jgi:protein-S-isoprenylcysteine O-methyltransferase Ste14
VGAVGARSLGHEPAFDLPAWGRVGLGAVHLAGWGVMLWSARFYDLGRLGGLAQLRRPDEAEDEPLRLDGPHARVRHPLYSGAFLILWGAALSPLGLATAVWGSLYLLAGTWCEERRLLARYGEAYAAYRARVPAFIPWRGPRKGRTGISV